MKALLINVEENTVEYVEPESLFDYYDLIHCELIDITNREIAGKRYDIICDDCGGRCQLCGRKLLLKDMSLDHIKPLSMGGVDDVSNLTCTCVPCNRFKANMAPDFFNNRINEIFLYQMKKGSRGKILQKFLYMFVARYAKENYTY